MQENAFAELYVIIFLLCLELVIIITLNNIKDLK